LEQAFNTLDAQRESCEAYIKSQAGEGWRLLTTQYDDGGFSGGNMDRPALKRLLADVDAGKVDTIVVYKVDRLTRSLMDFARIVEKLDARNVSFVSVTQAFNTTTSMGRLTLNVLLSFAQFEREVTGERIRDKVAASKAKGMWMGGNVPLGYDLGDRVLIVNETEARQVRIMFQRYLELGSVPALARELKAQGLGSKAWHSRGGNKRGGRPLGCGPIYYILQNRLYQGEVTHRGKAFAGDHDAIVSQELFGAVQQQLAANRKARKDKPARAATCPLLGLVYDADGQQMRSSFSYGHAGKCYRYYVSAAAVPSGGVASPVRRVAASGLERWVLDAAARLIGHFAPPWADVLALVARVEVHGRSTHLLLRVPALAEPHERAASLCARLEPRLAGARLVPDDSDLVRLIEDRRAVFRGGAREAWPEPSRTGHHRSGEILRAAHKLLKRHSMSPAGGERYGDATAPEYQRARRTLMLGLIAPDIQRGILEGRSELPADSFIGSPLPLAWADQRKLFT
jgi:DNA invertase Pin-like site-specific DNA recombinase